ncbi:MAG: hypothetical protein KAQ99_08435 [Candidatus Aureabacteria bacterium]|nr:hypothetical protein [Candidatus Auribacterota bacterium]
MGIENSSNNRAVYLALRDKSFYRLRESLRFPFANKSLVLRLKKAEELIDLLLHAERYAKLAISRTEINSQEVEFAGFLRALVSSAEVVKVMLLHERVLVGKGKIICDFSGVDEFDMIQSRTLHSDRAEEIIAGIKLLIDRSRAKIHSIQTASKKNFSKGDLDRYKRMYNMS